MNKDNKEETLSATLHLKTSDIATTSTEEAYSSVGYWTNFRARTTWYVNLRTLLGNEIYDKHNYFKIRLNNYTSIAYNPTGLGLWSNASSDNLLILYLSGLNFINNSFWQATQNNGAPFGAPLGQIQVSTGNTGANNLFNTTYTEDSAVVYFAKSVEQVEMTFSAVRLNIVGGSTLVTPATVALPIGVMPFCSITMRVSGVSKEEEKYLI
jgi:hypothetical protein